MTTHKQLETALRAYYTRYYRDELGLPNWAARVEMRLEEETVFAARLLDWIESWINYSFDGKRVLVVGGGTGAESFAMIERGAEVVAIEPNEAAITILRMKADLRQEKQNPGLMGIGEALPFRDGHFDLVFCYTVLEHTLDPERVVDEMIRVARVGGRIFIETPDYRHFYEPHYKMTMPMFAPKLLLRCWLRLKGRPGGFLRSLRFVTSRQLRNMFQERPVTAMQVIHSWPRSWQTNPTTQTRLTKWLTRTFGFQRDQYWLLQKLEKPR